MSDKSFLNFEKLNNENYPTWAFRMRMYLIKEELWDIVEAEHPPNMDARDILRKRAKALSTIVLGVETDQLVLLRGANTGREAWEMLKEYHQQNTIGNQMRSLKDIITMRLSPGGNMQIHIFKMFEVMNNLKDLGIDIPDVMFVALLLASVNDEYENLVTAIEAWPAERMVPSVVKAKLLEEWRKKVDKGRARSSGNVGNGAKEESAACLAKEIGPCFHCGGKHLIRNCREYLGMKSDNNKGTAKSDRMNRWYTCFSIACSGGNWAVDSGSSRHMTSNKDLFCKLYDCEASDVIVANGERLQSNGEGEIKLRVIVGKGDSLDVILENVLYVPKLEGNLLSVKQLLDKRFGVVFKGSECYLTRDSDSLLIARYEAGLFRLKSEVQEETSLSARTNVNYCLHEWHFVLAHRNLADIHRMKGQGLCVRSCDCSDICEPCIKGKMSVKPFPKKSTPVEALMDCVVTDVCGPIPVASIGRSKYFVTFTDMYSKYCEVYFIKTKDEVFSKIKHYVEMVKNQLGRKPKVIRSDRGREYYNKDVLDYLSGEGINFQCTVGYAPQQNGVSERKNRTLMEGARTLLVDARLGKHFWAEAVRHGNYVFNRIIPQGAEKSPYEMFYGKTPTYNDLHRFGCDVYSMIPYEKRRKIDNKAKKMVYVGNDDVSKGYRVADTQKQAISVSRNVRFLDEKKIDSRPEVEIEDLTMDVDEEPTNEPTNEPTDDSELNDTPMSEEPSNEELIQEEMQVDEGSQLEQTAEEPINEGPRRSSRTNAGKPSAHLDDYFVYSSVQEEKLYEPKNFDDAMKCKDKSKWLEAMKDELKSIEENGTWELTELPQSRKAIGSKWVYKIKLDESGRISKYKARLVAQGFSQKYGVDFDEVFAPVAKSSTFRLLLSVSGKKGYTVQHFDVKTAFLNGTLEEDIYLKQPPGFQNGTGVYKLSKSLYGLKQAARNWNLTLNKMFINNGFRQSNEDKCLYILRKGDRVCYVLVHVDDLLVASNSAELIQEVYKNVGKCCELKDLGEVKQYLGIDVHRDENGHFLISQSSYIEKIVSEAGLIEAKISTMPLDVGYFKTVSNTYLDSNDFYRKIIGMLLYLSTNSRPDISSTVAILSQKVAKPTNYDLNELRRVIRYLKGTRDLRLRLSSEGPTGELYAYSDANWAEDRMDRKSNSGYYVSVNGGALGWSCRKQNLVAMSSTEAEFIALSEATKELVWLKRLCAEFDVDIEDTTPIFTDSQSSMKIITNDGFSDRSKHIDTKFHYTKDMVTKKEVRLIYCPTDENIADMLTKPLGSIKLAKMRKKAGLEGHC